MWEICGIARGLAARGPPSRAPYGSRMYFKGPPILAEQESFEVLNEDDSILVMVDEVHRSQGNSLHANLMNSLPNCARIGSTGTPILKGDKKRTHENFGAYIGRYTIRQAEAEGGDPAHFV